ncbi:histidine kinase [Pseudofrankia sp. BMG5.37]|uniref:sensor histidine kinase n=1 Tax=Pseudofrankia sp. BMG5.37 TaxID=3050035 RepID=UPI002895CBAB|nr:histidine kinase [Pseudofrankia sp. BMG5.37]MDT3440733.1 histidine kinase [Pseudofrankia sp. BMG5.37]
MSAVAGLLLVLGGLCVGTVGRLVAGRAPVVAGVAAPVRWLADVEWWRIARVRSVAAGAEGLGRRSRPSGAAAASDPGMWLGLAHVVVVLPVAVVTAVVTALWWFLGVAAATTAVRNRGAWAGTMQPMTLSAGSAQSHIDVSLGLTSPAERMTFGTVVGLLLMMVLPLVTRVCVAAQARLGRALLSDASPLHRRISGLEQERDTARAQTVAAVTAEAAALRRLERDIHDGPQQRLVRLAMELGRAQRHFDRRPETVREALADALVQAEEALDELRALSHGIAPPILVDRGLREALAELAARSTVSAQLDGGPLSHRPEAAVETAAYFVVSEALTNVGKHSRAGRCVIGLRHDAAALRSG